MAFAAFVPELMEDVQRRALMAALEHLLEDDAIGEIWPAFFDSNSSGRPIPVNEIEIVVLPLDRIGAPAGASGARVFVAYYSHTPTAGAQLVASPPMVVKIGSAPSLRDEKAGADEWPHLSQQEAARFARPVYLDETDPDWAILIAPFHSLFETRDGGGRNIVKLDDLWQMLNNKNELSSLDAEHWKRVRRCIGQALDALQSPHRASLAKPKRARYDFDSAYNWYLRSTTGSGRLSHIPRLIFGIEPTITMFGQTWTNPVPVIEKLVATNSFEGYFGSVHGDLHPKNIVLNHEHAARIIDFGWARSNAHIVQDYLLLDLNVRGVTLPSQMSESDILAIASFLDPVQCVDALPLSVQPRAEIIKDVIWQRAKQRAVKDWSTEYLTPFLLVAYGLLVHLDSARNQPALVATILSATRALIAQGVIGTA